MASDILGRGAELAAVRSFMASVATGPTALLLVGEPGIGKTTVWHAGIRLARDRGYQVLAGTSVEAEAKLAYVALGDLLRPVLDRTLDRLPPPQRRALEIALLRASPEGTRPDRRAVGLAVFAALRSLAVERPLVLAIDDLQWVDAATAAVLTFAIRRMEREPAGVLATLRQEAQADEPQLTAALPGTTVRLTLGPLGLDALARMLRTRSSVDFSRPLLLRLEAASGGNPFFFLELARAIRETGADVEPGKPLPVPEDVGQLLRARLRALPTECREPLLFAAMMVKPTLIMLRLLSDDPRQTETGLRRASEAGVVAIDDEIRFSHPLLSSAVYAEATVQERRRTHRRLAAATIDPEERARHLALASSGPDEGVAAKLDEAALLARNRGAPDAAAELGALAAHMTPSREVLALNRRRLESAWYHYDAGDVAEARAVAEELAASGAKADRAQALILQITSLGEDVRRIAPLAEDLLAQAGDDPTLCAVAHITLARVAYRAETMARAAENAAKASILAERSGDPDLVLSAHAEAALIAGMSGEDGLEALQQAERPERGTASSERYDMLREHRGRLLLWAGDLEEARSALQGCLVWAEEHGLEMVREAPLRLQSEIELRAGNLDRALALADEALEISLHGSEESVAPALGARAMVLAWLGELDRARADANDALARSTAYRCRWDEISSRWALGFIDLSIGNADAAVGNLRPAAELIKGMGFVEPGIFPLQPDLAEALVMLGEFDEADALALWLEDSGVQRARPLAIASGARCRGLVAAARGHFGDALAHFDRAMGERAHASQPLEFARTMFVRGETLRRAKRRRDSREVLQAARDLFERLAAPVWASKARRGLARIGGRTQSRLELTPTEAQIAALVAKGKTNSEVAADLFISTKTVEANLSRVYRKLGIHSRRELSTALLDPRVAQT